MAKEGFHEYVMFDLLGDRPGVVSKKMFGGYGIYENGKIFAIIAGEGLYLKANSEHARSYFREHGGHPFVYQKKNGKAYTMSYWLVPEEIAEDRESFAAWVRTAQ